jgi:hypothetical protein
MNGRIVANLFGQYRGEKVKANARVALETTAKNEQGRSPLEARSIPYRLQVETVIQLADLPTLARGAKELVGLIESTDALKLLNAMMRVDKDQVRLFHYWNLDYDADNLTRAELRLPDAPGYARFEKIIVDEIKDIVIPAARARRELPAAEVLGRYVYMRVAYLVGSDKLAEFQARLEACLLPFAYANGWYLGDSFLGITGQAGKIAQYWVVPEGAVALAPSRLAAAPWQSLLRQPAAYEFLEPLPTDFFLGDLATQERELAVAAVHESKNSKSQGSEEGGSDAK